MVELLLVLFSSFNLWAADPSACRSATGSGLKTCIKEFNKTTKSMFQVGLAPQSCQAHLNSTEANCPPLAEEFSQKAANCEGFITSDGEYGSWGKEIVAYLDEKGESATFFNKDLAGMKNGISACPNWSKMNTDEKKHFWVWVMASIAHIESTCNPSARNSSASNGVAVGLLQLDERPAQRKWRGPNCAARQVVGAKENLRCGLDILEELLKGKEGEYKSNGQIWGPKSSSYWQHLRKKDGGEISDLIALNPFCKK